MQNSRERESNGQPLVSVQPTSLTLRRLRVFNRIDLVWTDKVRFKSQTRCRQGLRLAGALNFLANRADSSLSFLTYRTAYRTAGVRPIRAFTVP